jgi:hypothetical protein
MFSGAKDNRCPVSAASYLFRVLLRLVLARYAAAAMIMIAKITVANVVMLGSLLVVWVWSV